MCHWLWRLENRKKLEKISKETAITDWENEIHVVQWQKQLVKLSLMAIWKFGKTSGPEQDDFQGKMLSVS